MKKIISIILLITIFLGFSNLGFAAGKKSKKAEPVVIQFQARDNFNLVGAIDIPERATVKNKVPLVIFLHSLGSDRREWLNYPSKFKALGYATLNLDLRGHGQSIYNANEKIRYWKGFKNQEFAKMSDDVVSAVKYIEQEYLEVDTKNITIVASSIGTDAAIFAGAKMKYKVKTLVLLSPIINYKGLDPRISLVEYGSHPVLMLVTKQDVYSYRAANDLLRYVQGVKKLQVYNNAGNGVSILKFQPQSQKTIIDWVIKYTYHVK